MAQTIRSDKTSRNQLAAGFKLVDKISPWNPTGTNLDYGGGRFNKAKEYLSIFNVTNVIYDPYNRSEDENKKALEVFSTCASSHKTITCFNVLNVIKEDSVIIEILTHIKTFGSPTYFTFYEGNSTSTGKQTRDGWQRNEKTESYLEIIRPHFRVQKIGKLVVAK